MLADGPLISSLFLRRSHQMTCARVEEVVWAELRLGRDKEAGSVVYL